MSKDVLAATLLSCAFSRVALRRGSGARRPPGSDRMQSEHDVRPSRGYPLDGACRPHDDVWQRVHSVARPVRDARES
jgi:hypothetical protein